MQTAEHTVKEMKEIWGGNLPSWEDFKKVLKDGLIRSNKTIAAQVIRMKRMPKADLIIWGGHCCAEEYMEDMSKLNIPYGRDS